MKIKNPKQYYIDNGYCIFEQVIGIKKIEKLLRILESVKKSNSIYQSQSEHNWRVFKNDLDEHNLLTSSVANFTDNLWIPFLGKSGRSILQSKEILEILRKVSDEREFIMWQNMLFDKSTGTIDHIDTYYLDTYPRGNLIAAWIALENTNEEGGTFHIYPRSHLNVPDDWKNLSHDEFTNWINEYSKKFKRKDIKLKKGDVLLWHPSLIHGSSLQKTPGFSRKSLTAHYHPVSYLRIELEQNFKELNASKLNKTQTQKRIEYQNEISRSWGHPINAMAKKKLMIRKSIFGLRDYILGKFNLKLNQPFMLMNRKNYEKQ